SLVSGGKPLVLKSPAHSYRVSTLRELLPDPRFVLIVRSPYEVLESMVRTYKALTEKYGLGPGLSEDRLREIILRERLRFEAQLQSCIAGLKPRRFATVKFEQLIADPVTTLQSLYQQLEIPDFEQARPKLAAEVARRSAYVQESMKPDRQWTRRIELEW